MDGASWDKYANVQFQVHWGEELFQDMSLFSSTLDSKNVSCDSGFIMAVTNASLIYFEGGQVWTKTLLLDIALTWHCFSKGSSSTIRLGSIKGSVLLAREISE